MTNGITDDALAAYASDILDKEADIEALQDGKKAVYANLRDTYGKRTANALKLAVKRYRMDAEKLQEAEELDADAEHFLTIIRRPRAPRATRVASAVPDPEHTTAPEAPASAGEAVDATPSPRPPSNVTALRTHDPDKHFLNSEGRPRLHGCLKPDLCGSQRPHGELCWSCAVRKPNQAASA